MEQTILLVEDDNNDRWFSTLAFEFIGLGCNLRFVPDGQEAIDYLGGIGKYRDRSQFPLPHLILLDMKLPKLSGMEVLKWIRAQPQFRSAIVIPLTSSAFQEDIVAAHTAGANDYLIKPLQLAQWRALAQYIQSCWLPQSMHHMPAALPSQVVHSVSRGEEAS
jgi:CheY-like chemotaxis protein